MPKKRKDCTGKPKKDGSGKGCRKGQKGKKKK